MGTVRETPQGTFRVRWYDQHGKQHSKTLTTRTQGNQFLKQVEGAVASGTFVDQTRARIPLREWIEDCRATDFNLEVGSVVVEGRIAQHVNDAMGDVLLSNVTSSTVERYIAERLRNGASGGYVAMEFRVLRKWFNRAVAKELLRKNPCKGVKAPTSDRAEMRFLTMSELVALAEAMPPRYRAWVYVMGTIGLRYSEAVGLRRSSVKLLERKLEIVEQLVFQDGRWIRKQKLKTRQSRRTVTIASPLLEILGEHLERFSQPGDDGLVFQNGNGNPLGHSSFTQCFKRALKRAGLDQSIRIHDLRHTAVALAIAEGAHPTAIMRRLGHSSINVTLGTYGHLFPELDEQLADKLGTKLEKALSGRVVVPIGRKAS